MTTPNAAFSTTSAPFTQPAAGSVVTATMLDGTLYACGQYVQVGSGGVYTVVGNSPTSIDLLNLAGYLPNAPIRYIVPTGTPVFPLGTTFAAGQVAPVTRIILPTNGFAHDVSIVVPPLVLLRAPLVRIIDPLVGAGNCDIKIGTSPGGAELLATFTINDTLPAGTIIGLLLAEAGSDLDPAAGYTEGYEAAQTLTVRLTPTPPVTGGSIIVSINGQLLG